MMAKKKTDNAALARLEQALKTGTLGRCYILYGEEGYLREVYFEKIKKALLSGPAESFNFHRFTRETLDWDAVAEAVEALPMMAERTLTVVDDIDLFKEPAAAREKIAAILSDLPAHACLVFRYDTVPFAPDGKMKKLSQALAAAEAVEFGKQDARVLREWIRRRVKAGGKDIDIMTSDYLAFLTDNSLASLAGEIDKLTAYAKGELITKEDVDAVVEPALTAVSFDISNAVAGGDYDRALCKLRELFAMQQDPDLLLGAIASQMRRLQCAKVLSENGKGILELKELCGMKSEYPARLAMNEARRLSGRFCDRAVLLCLEANRRLRSSCDNPQRLLELLLIRMAGEARA